MSVHFEDLTIKERANSLKQCGGCKLSQLDVGKQFQSCSRCMSERYCSRECQVKSWPLHKEMCNSNAANDKKLVKMAEGIGRGSSELTCLNEQVHGFLSYYRPLLVTIAKYAIDLFPIRKAGFTVPKQYVEVELIPKCFTRGSEMLGEPIVKGKDAFILGSIRTRKIGEEPGLLPTWEGILNKYRNEKGEEKCCSAVILVAKCAIIDTITSWGIAESWRNTEKVVDLWHDLLEIAMEEGIEAIDPDSYE